VNAWKHPHKQVPSIHAIWKIYCNSLLNGQYNAYKAEVEKIQQLEGKPFPKGEGRRIMSAGNEQRRFHGTKLYVFFISFKSINMNFFKKIFTLFLIGGVKLDSKEVKYVMINNVQYALL
jgi:hypothetical protein